MDQSMTDITEMSAVHDCLRHEFAKLPLTVKAVANDDSARAAVVGGHVLFMTALLHAHHVGEDTCLSPVLRERAAGNDEFIVVMADQHDRLFALADTSELQARAWMAGPGHQERASLHTTLIALEKELLHHLAHEEQEVLPLVQQLLTQEEVDRIGGHARSALAPDLVPIALGFILDDTSSRNAEVLLAAMSAPAREEFETNGREAFRVYKATLVDY